MTTKKHYTVEALSKNEKQLFDTFNSLTAEEQSRTLDILYDAMYGKNIRLIMAGRIIKSAEKETEELKQTIIELENENAELRKKARNIDKLYASIPKEERKQFAKEIVSEFKYRDLVKSINSLRAENTELKKQLEQ